MDAAGSCGLLIRGLWVRVPRGPPTKKWDGYRAVIVRAPTGAHDDDRESRSGNGFVRIWSRPGKDLTAQFPDIATAAAAQLPDGCVVDPVLSHAPKPIRLVQSLVRRLQLGSMNGHDLGKEPGPYRRASNMC
jgi:hypothetical protein